MTEQQLAVPASKRLTAPIRAMRPRQWTKNVLVATAPLAAGLLLDPRVLAGVALAFVSFCLVSAAVYLLNDVRDVEEDRLHPRKRLRPIAAGELSPGFALGHLVHGMAALYSGNANLAVQSLERGLLLNRYDPQNFVWYNVLALAFLFDGDAEAALQRAIAALKVRPAWRPAMRSAAAASAALGRREAAARWLRQWSEMPATSSDALMPLWRRNPQWTEEMDRLLQDDKPQQAAPK